MAEEDESARVFTWLREFKAEFSQRGLTMPGSGRPRDPGWRSRRRGCGQGVRGVRSASHDLAHVRRVALLCRGATEEMKNRCAAE